MNNEDKAEVIGVLSTVEDNWSAVPNGGSWM